MCRFIFSFFYGASFILLCTGEVAGQTFVHRFGHSNRTENATTVAMAPNGNLVIGGSIGPNAMIAMVTAGGQLAWDYEFLTLNPGYNQAVSSLAITPDGYLIGTGNLNPGADHPQPVRGFMFKMNMQGNLIWCKYGNSSPIANFDRLIPYGPNEYLLTLGYDMKHTTLADIGVAMVNAADGSIIAFSDRYDFAPGALRDEPEGCVKDEAGNIYITGKTNVNSASYGAVRPYIACFAPDLRLSWVKYHMFPSSVTARMMGTEIIRSGDSLVVLVCGSPNSTSGAFQMGLYKTDRHGNLGWSKLYDMPNCVQEMGYSLVETPAGYLMIASEESNLTLFALQTDFQGNVLWCNRYAPGVLRSQAVRWSNSSIYANERVWFAGNEFAGSPDIFLGSIDLSGGSSCLPYEAGSPVVTVIPPFTMATSAVAHAHDLFFLDGPIRTGTELGERCPTTTSLPVLGPDDSLCQGSITLDATVQGAMGYVWQDGSTNPTFVVQSPGTYWVVISLNCCTRTDTIHITAPIIDLNLGPDLLLCNGATAVLNANYPAVNYAWSTGQSGPSIAVDSAGTYTVTITTSEGCTATDIVEVDMDSLDVSLGNDTTVCYTTGLMLNPGHSGANYHWSTGSYAPSILVGQSGTYQVTVSYGPYCVDSDTVEVTVNGHSLLLGPDTSICDNSVLPLGVSNVSGDFVWSTGDTTSAILVTGPGTYAVSVTDSTGCVSQDTIVIGSIALPILNLGRDTVICGEDGLQLRSPIEGIAYHWSTGAATASIFVNATGGYWLGVVTECGTVCDSVHVELIHSSDLFVPNVFSPNGDGINDAFRIEGRVYEGFDVEVYDRWGNLHYASDNILDGWDGRIGGGNAPEGVYYYTLKVMGCDRKLTNQTGTVTLLR